MSAKSEKAERWSFENILYVNELLSGLFIVSYKNDYSVVHTCTHTYCNKLMFV